MNAEQWLSDRVSVPIRSEQLMRSIVDAMESYAREKQLSRFELIAVIDKTVAAHQCLDACVIADDLMRAQEKKRQK